MDEVTEMVNPDHLQFFITAPGETDGLFIAVTIFMVLVILAFGAFYFTVQSIPDRMVEGAGKAQMQVVGLLGLLSLFTMNNIFWDGGTANCGHQNSGLHYAAEPDCQIDQQAGKGVT